MLQKNHSLVLYCLRFLSNLYWNRTKFCFWNWQIPRNVAFRKQKTAAIGFDDLDRTSLDDHYRNVLIRVNSVKSKTSIYSVNHHEIRISDRCEQRLRLRIDKTDSYTCKSAEIYHWNLPEYRKGKGKVMD